MNLPLFRCCSSRIAEYCYFYLPLFCAAAWLARSSSSSSSSTQHCLSLLLNPTSPPARFLPLTDHASRATTAPLFNMDKVHSTHYFTAHPTPYNRGPSSAVICFLHYHSMILISSTQCLIECLIFFSSCVRIIEIGTRFPSTGRCRLFASESRLERPIGLQILATVSRKVTVAVLARVTLTALSSNTFLVVNGAPIADWQRRGPSRQFEHGVDTPPPIEIRHCCVTLCNILLWY